MSFTTLLLWLLGLAYAGVSLWLILIVLLQEGKSGGMAGLDSAADSPAALTDSFGAGGAQKSLYNWTRNFAIIFFVLAALLTVVANKRDHEGGMLNLPSGSSQTEESAPSGGMMGTGSPEEAPESQ